MASKTREEYVGKRFLSVKSDGKLKISKISEWEWRSGVVRAVSTRDSSNADFTVLVEFDDTGWKNREYFKVHEVFQEFLVEHSLAWVERDEPDFSPHLGQWPALSYKAIVDKPDLSRHNRRPVEFLSDRFLSFVDEKEICLYKEGDELRVSTALACPEVRKWVKSWTDYQDGQKILLTTPTVLLGYRVEVYRTEGTTQWYTAVIKAYNHSNKSLTLVDDTVLEEHNEDPTLIQMHLIGDGVVDSILNGVDVGVAQRRRPRSTVIKQNSKDTSTISYSNRNCGSHQGSGSASSISSKTSNVSITSNSLQSSTTTTTTTTTAATTASSSSSSSTSVTSSSNNSSNSISSTSPSPRPSASKSRPSSASAVSHTPSPSPPPGQRGAATSPAPHKDSPTAKLSDTPALKGPSPRNQRPTTTKRRPEPPLSKSGKKTPPALGKKLKKSPSEDSVEDESSTATVCHQTCNVIVERIVEDKKPLQSSRERTKPKPPRLRDKPSPASKKSPPRVPEEKDKDGNFVSDAPSNVSRRATKAYEPSSPVVVAASDRETRKSKKAAAASVSTSAAAAAAGELRQQANAEASSPPKQVREESEKAAASSLAKQSSTSSTKKASSRPSAEAAVSSPEDVNARDGGKSKQQETRPGTATVVTPLSSSSFSSLLSSSSSLPSPPALCAKSTAENASNVTITLAESLVKSPECAVYKGSDDSKSRVVVELGKAKPPSGGNNEVIVVSSSDSSYKSVIKGHTDSVVVVDSKHCDESKSKSCPPGEDSEEGSMHYKKQKILRASGPSPNNPTPSISEGINVNISLTDQLTKRNKSNFSVNGEGKTGSDTAISSDSLSPPNPLPHFSRDRLLDHGAANLYKVHDFAGERHSAFSSVSHGNAAATRPSEDRSDSRASDSQLPGHLEDKRPGSRLEDIRSVRSSPGSSPLIVDKHEAVHPYRDPILMRNSSVQSTILAAQQQMNPQNFPVVHQTAPGGPPPSQPGGTFPGVASIPTRGLLQTLPIPSTLPYSSGHPLPASLSHHLNMSHGYTVEALTARAQAQHQHLLLQQQQQPLMGYPLSSAGIASMDPVWQKLPSNPLTQWSLQKNPESLLAPGEYAALHREQLIHFDHERREFERREADRLEKEMREKERKDSMERERLEKEKVEREKAAERERERQERERSERERQEKDRLERERERQEWEEHKHQQERILRASEVDTVAAVDEHFAASLNKFTTQKGGMFSLARGAPGRPPFMAKSETRPPHVPPGMVYSEKAMVVDHLKEERQKREPDQLDDKRFVSKASEKPSAYPLYQQYSGNPGNPQAGQKPVFSLYGYPSSPSTITTEQLKQRGLITDTRTVKEEIQDKKLPFSSAQIPVSHAHAHGLSYHVKDMKREPHNSVIVTRDSKIKMEPPIAAHSHHNSPSSSSPRPQHPRPAHTPEHRPDRPHSSSASPASGIPGHLLHHSSVVTSGPAHLPPSHSPVFRAADSHISPRSQSPYKLVASQPQNMPQPLDYCKSSSSKPKPLTEPLHQRLSAEPLHQRVSAEPLHQRVSAEPLHQRVSVPSSYSTQTPVSLTNSSMAYSYSLVQQGLVPNPLYSRPSSQPTQQHHNPAPLNPTPLNMGRQPPPTSIAGSRPVQHSPPGSKRKSGSKDSIPYTQKKAKNQTDMQGARPQPMSIPVTTPQIMTNPSPYTTTNSNVFLKYSTGAVTSSTSSPSVTASSFPSAKTGYLDNFKSFVENTVQLSFQQQNEKAERERAIAAAAASAESGIKPDSFHPAMKTQDTRGVPLSSTSNAAVPVPVAQGRVEVGPTSDSYSSRIMDTINRVANNQVDTDSDTLSASSPPPQIKPSDTNSPLSKSCSGTSSGSSHPHHMKKAWLQRHDEDKKSETPVFSNPGEEDSNSSLTHTKDMISCIENSTASLNDQGQDSVSTSPANVVVTLPNGNISDLNHHIDESTSSASEAETQSPSKVFGAKKRVKQRKSASGSAKKTKTESELASVVKPVLSPSSSPPGSISSGNGNDNGSGNPRKKASAPNRRNKPDKDPKTKEESTSGKEEEQCFSSSKQSRDNSALPSRQDKNSRVPMPVPTPAQAPSPHSPQSERSNPSPALSESNTAGSLSSSSSSSSSSTTNTPTVSISHNSNSKENKDKKKTTRRGKDNKKSSSFNKPLVKHSVASLKKSLEPFIQDGSCSEITPKLTKCRECKMTPVQRSKKQPNIFCRFYAFRRLRYNQRGIVKIEGFSELSDADPDDIEPWLPRYPIEEPDLEVVNSKFIIANVGAKFCELVEQEREAKSWAGEEVKIVWKRAVMGVREMCDVCDTTLFNMHWVCRKCGFVVCLDCYKVRIKEGKKNLNDDKWLTCSSNRQAHDAQEMMLTQIIPSDALWELGRLIHEICIKWSIPSNCPCGGSNVENSGRALSKNGINQQLLHAVSNHKLPNGLGSDNHGKEANKAKKHQDTLDSYNPATTSSPLSILAEVAYMDSESNRDKADPKRKADKSHEEDITEEGEKKGCSTLRELLTKTARKVKAPNDKKTKKGSGNSTLVDIIHSVVEKSCLDGGAPFKFLHYTPRLGGWKRELPIMVHNLTETSVLYPDVPHSWLCDGRLLRLHDAHHKGNLQIFQEQWKRGQPVLVSCANKAMNISLWKPEVFSKEFGHIKNEVVNCRTGDAIIGHTMSEFWDGFENLSERPTDDNDEPMLLKLKDWPPGDDFSELLPSRFQDLMQALPLPEYTQRNGKLNLASRLPDFLVRPDLGPKMYNAYGSSQYPNEGTTNLHLDISDAVNVMVYVGVPSDGPGGRKAQEEAAVKAIDDVGCDSITKRRVREVHEIPGALWHIYDAHDADKIRDFLNKVAKERGEIIETDHDAIHDQSWYLTKELCDRLYKEYGVQGYTIVQCLGDSIFIPAGAPHQVRNLHSCVKVAEDFVSPEHLNHCFRLTQEFRQLSETHTNHEDKLQVKNIIYHAVKDAIAVLREHDPKDE